MPGRNWPGGAGVACRIAVSSCPRFSPSKAGTPATISYSSEPSENTSLRWSAAWPPTCSGDMYLGDPIIVPLCVRTSELFIRAMPKSMIFACPSPTSMMLPGLMSRCTTPRACATASAEATWPAMSSASSSGSAPCAMRSRNSTPCSSSIAM